jgi:branched-chain amino acid transport system permease protein
LEFVRLRRLRTADPLRAVIATVFVSIALSEGARLIFQSDILSVPSLFSGPPLLRTPLVITPETAWIAGGALGTGLLALVILRTTRIGFEMRSVAANPRGAAVSGVRVGRIYAAAWFAGGALAGLAGVFVAPRVGASPELASAMIVPAFVAGVLGGFDSLAGALLGGLILGLVEVGASAVMPGGFQSAVSLVLLAVAMLAIPRGLFPERKVRRA